MLNLKDIANDAAMAHAVRGMNYSESAPLGEAGERAWDFIFALTTGEETKPPLVTLRTPKKYEALTGVKLQALNNEILEVKLMSRGDEAPYFESDDHDGTTDHFDFRKDGETDRFLTSVVEWAVENTPPHLHIELLRTIAAAQTYLQEADRERAQLPQAEPPQQVPGGPEEAIRP